MALPLNHNMMSYAPHAAAFACGAVVGYTFAATGDLLSPALIATGCGVARAASNIIYSDPFTKQLLLTINVNAIAQGGTKDPNVETCIRELDLQRKKMEIVNGLYKMSWAFSVGITLGTGTGISGTSLLSGFFSGALIKITNILSEVLPSTAMRESSLQFDRNTGKQI